MVKFNNKKPINKINKFTKIQKFNILNKSLKEYIDIIKDCIVNSRDYIKCIDSTNMMICELYQIKNKKILPLMNGKI